jgi:2-oxoglutarate ferredoxin oxidoreductase subunit alpha
LMSEYAGLAYFAEVPIVVWDIQRMGPSTGLPTRTSQGDINLAFFLGHGDTKHVVLFPGSVTECFEFGWKALDLAEQLQTPVFVLSDLDLGMNQWMTKPFQYPDTPIKRGKVLWEEDFEKLTEKWGRYLDKDGDGIPYRTVPGNRHPASAYFARGTGHDEYATYSEDGETWVKNMKRLNVKFDTARTLVPEPEIHTLEGVMNFIRNYEHIYVIEMNRDGQLHQILSLEMPECATSLISLTHNDGLQITATWVKEAIQAKENK